MKTKKPWRFVSIAVLTAALWSFAGFDQVQAFGPAIGGMGSPRVLFVGIFYPLEQKAKVWRMNTITVKVKNKEWLFSIKKARALTGGMDQSAILENIWPPVLTFRGSDKVIDPLLKPDIVGKRFTLDGILYFSDRIFQIYSAVEVIEKKEKKGGKSKNE